MSDRDTDVPDEDATLLERHDDSDEYQEQDYGGEPTHSPTPQQEEAQDEGEAQRR